MSPTIRVWWISTARGRLGERQAVRLIGCILIVMNTPGAWAMGGAFAPRGFDVVGWPRRGADPRPGFGQGRAEEKREPLCRVMVFLQECEVA
jgi:hypothetical protein